MAEEDWEAQSHFMGVINGEVSDDEYEEHEDINAADLVNVNYNNDEDINAADLVNVNYNNDDECEEEEDINAADINAADLVNVNDTMSETIVQSFDWLTY